MADSNEDSSSIVRYSTVSDTTIDLDTSDKLPDLLQIVLKVLRGPEYDG